MTPYKFTRHGSTVKYHYRFSQLRKFLTLGKAEGNTGMILIKESEKYTTHKGFGTIERPRTTMLSFHMAPAPFFGPRTTPEERINPLQDFPFKNLGYFFPQKRPN